MGPWTRVRNQTFDSSATLFKQEKDHFYDEPKNQNEDSELLTRSHSLADSVTIGMLKMKGFNIEARDRDFYPLMNNWGVKWWD